MNEAMEKMRVGIETVQITIADRFTPVIRQAAYAMHVWMVEGWPWWKVWWHTMTGHRKDWWH